MEKKVIIFNAINLLIVVCIFLLIRDLPFKATELKTLRTQKINLTEQSELMVASAEIDKNQQKIDEIKARFIEEKGILSFISDVDKLKDFGSVGKFPIISNESTKDQTKNSGLPVSIEFRGDINRINSALQNLQSLPYLIRPIQFELEYFADPGEYGLKYGGFLYIE